MTIGDIKKAIEQRNEIGAYLTKQKLYSAEISYTNGPEALRAKRDLRSIENEWNDINRSLPLIQVGETSMTADQVTRYCDCSDDEDVEVVIARILELRTIH